MSCILQAPSEKKRLIRATAKALQQALSRHVLLTLHHSAAGSMSSSHPPRSSVTMFAGCWTARIGKVAGVVDDDEEEVDGAGALQVKLGAVLAKVSTISKDASAGQSPSSKLSSACPSVSWK